MNKWIKYRIEVDDWDNLLRYSFLEAFNELGYGDFCDVGSCNGLFINIFREISSNSKIFAFEPNPFNYENIKSMSSDNCIIENIAVSDIDGYVNLYSESNDPRNHLSNIIGHDLNNQKMNFLSEVESKKLDTYFSEKKVDYIKIDVEGSEIDVIRGGIETLKKCKYVIIECHYDNDWKEIVNLCESNNLQFRNLVDDEIIYHGETTKISGISSNGRTYQMYLKNR
jgi:FkbM family methyltransferase